MVKLMEGICQHDMPNHKLSRRHCGHGEQNGVHLTNTSFECRLDRKACRADCPPLSPTCSASSTVVEDLSPGSLTVALAARSREGNESRSRDSANAAARTLDAHRMLPMDFFRVDIKLKEVQFPVHLKSPDIHVIAIKAIKEKRTDATHLLELEKSKNTPSRLAYLCRSA